MDPKQWDSSFKDPKIEPPIGGNSQVYLPVVPGALGGFEKRNPQFWTPILLYDLYGLDYRALRWL